MTVELLIYTHAAPHYGAHFATVEVADKSAAVALMIEYNAKFKKDGRISVKFPAPAEK